MESNILSRNFAASVSVVWVDQVLVLVNGIWDMKCHEGEKVAHSLHAPPDVLRVQKPVPQLGKNICRFHPPPIEEYSCRQIP